MTVRSETGISTRSLVRYLIALVTGALIVPTVFLAVLALLGQEGALPPPQFSNSICIDEKLAAMRRSPPQNPDLLAVGSSVAWRHFNSEVAIGEYPGLLPYNAGFCGANIAQTELVVAWMTERLPSVEEVILIASPVDFEFCDDQPADGLFPSTFDVTEADRFVFEDTWSLFYYLQYFDPWTLFKNSRDIAARRSDMTSYATLMINEYGDGPIEPAQDRRLLYGAPVFDTTCFEGLRQTALYLSQRQIDFSVAVTPLHPEWLRIYDKGGEVTETLRAGIREALIGTEGRFVEPDTNFGESAFFDAIHIRWSYTDEFTRSLLAAVKRPV